MKKLLLSVGIAFLSTAGFSQIIFTVEAPASIAGAYDFTANDDGSSWGLASLAGIQVLDTIMLANDGASGTNAQGNPASATGCIALPPGSLAGKIAMVYRYDGVGVGNCTFGVKALNAQNAGAVAVLIVNREEAVIAMAGGTEGASVTVPVAFITQSTGLAILQRMQALDTVVGFLGDKTGLYADDFSIYDNRALRADVGSMPLLLAQNASEFNVPLAAWVFNYGQNDQNGITMTAVVKRNGSTVSTQTTAPATINSGDSLYMTLPAFSLATYTTDDYELTYTVQNSVTDLYPADNIVVSTFHVSDSLWSLARLVDSTVVAVDNFYRPNTLPTDNFQTCVVLTNPNASRLQMDGIYFGGITVAAADSVTTVNDQFITASLFGWNDANTGTTTATFDALDELATGDYTYTSELAEETVYIPFSSPYTLVNNQNYMVCVTTVEPLLFTAYSDKDYYDENIVANDETRFPIFSDNAPVNVGAGFGISPSIAAKVQAVAGINENTIETSSFPNPTKDVITVKVNASGNAVLNITDLAGRTISTQKITISGGKFITNVSGMNSGTYVFNLSLENGSTSQFKVVVTK